MPKELTLFPDIRKPVAAFLNGVNDESFNLGDGFRSPEHDFFIRGIEMAGHEKGIEP
jgi:hypothetical protein